MEDFSKKALLVLLCLFASACSSVFKKADTPEIKTSKSDLFNDLHKQQKILNDYVNINESLISRLTENYDDLKNNFEKISTNLENISEIFTFMVETNCAYADWPEVSDDFFPRDISRYLCRLILFRGLQT